MLRAKRWSHSQKVNVVTTKPVKKKKHTFALKKKNMLLIQCSTIFVSEQKFWVLIYKMKSAFSNKIPKISKKHKEKRKIFFVFVWPQQFVLSDALNTFESTAQKSISQHLCEHKLKISQEAT